MEFHENHLSCSRGCSASAQNTRLSCQRCDISAFILIKFSSVVDCRFHDSFMFEYDILPLDITENGSFCRLIIYSSLVCVQKLPGVFQVI